MTIKSQKGFTLVELAILLAIIGLILGGILGGRALLESARVSSAYNDIRDFMAATITYRSRTNNLPGLNGIPGGANAYGGAWYQSTDPNNINVNFFDDLRDEGLIEVGTNGELIKNPFGGVYGVRGPTFGANSGIHFCMSNVPASAAAVLDNRYDDGVANTGEVRGIPGANGRWSVDNNPAPNSTYEGISHAVCVNTDIS